MNGLDKFLLEKLSPGRRVALSCVAGIAYSTVAVMLFLDGSIIGTAATALAALISLINTLLYARDARRKKSAESRLN